MSCGRPLLGACPSAPSGGSRAPAGPAWRPALTAVPGLRTSFTWTGNVSSRWDSGFNWSPPTGGYPDGCEDDAVIPSSPTPHSIDLVTLAIDGLTIYGDVNFSSYSSSNTLTVDSLTIVDAVVNITDAARIETVIDCDPP